MKKLMAIMMMGVLTVSLAACGGSTGTSEEASQPEAAVTQTEQSPETESVETESTEPESAETESSESESAETESAEVESTETENAETESAEAESTEPESTEETEVENTETAEAGKTLVAYFSWSGNTEQLAAMVQSETGGDLFEIVPATAYTEDYDTLLTVAQQEKSDGARPALASQVENWDEYDTIFVGYPNWWSDAPMIILSFLESYDCSGKTIVPFCTSGGGGFGSSLSSITNSASGATIADAFHVGGSNVGGAQEDVATWIAGLNLVQ